MRHRARSIAWAGQTFRFERLERAPDGREITWSVFRRGEFIGTLSCPEDITTREFDQRCERWLADLLSSAPRQ